MLRVGLTADWAAAKALLRKLCARWARGIEADELGVR